MTNKELINKYPFLQIEGQEEEGTWLDVMPSGWSKAFGELLCEDIQAIYDKHQIDSRNLKIQDIKEKWGGLRIHFSASFEVFEEIHKIIDCYSKLSEHICINCGKPDVPMIIRGWYYPCCEQCYSGKDWGKSIISKSNKMATDLIWYGVEEKRKDLTDIANRIRERSRENEKRN